MLGYWGGGNLWERIAAGKEQHREDAPEICTDDHEFKVMDTKGHAPWGPSENRYWEVVRGPEVHKSHSAWKRAFWSAKMETPHWVFWVFK